MRKFYSFLLMAILSVVSFSAKAEDFTIKVVIADEAYMDQVKVQKYDNDVWDYVDVPFVFGENVYTYDDADEVELSIRLCSAVDWDFEQELGFESVTGYAPGSDEPVDLTRLFKGNYGWEDITLQFYVTDINWDGVDEDFNGWTITFSMKSQAELNKGTINVYCDQPEKVVLQIGSMWGKYTEIPLTESGDTPNVVEYDVMSQYDWQIMPASEDDSIFSVICDGTDIPNYDGIYDFYPESGSEVKITVAAPDYDCTVSISVPEGAEGAIEKVEVEEEAVDYSAPFTVKPGQIVVVYFNDAYNIKSIALNGIGGYDGYGGFTNFRILDEENVIEIDAAPWEVYNVTLNVDNPAAVKVSKGVSAYSADPISGIVESQVIEVYENKKCVIIEPVDGYVVKSVSYKNIAGMTVQVSPDWSGAYSVTCSNSVTQIDVETGVFARDNVAYIYIDDPNQNGFIIRRANYNIMLEYPNYGGGNTVMQAGYNRVEFASSESPFRFEGYPESAPVVYVNNVISDAIEFSNWMGLDGALSVANNDVVKIFFNEVNQHNVSFTLDGLSESDVEIVADKVVPVVASNGHACLTGTEIVITPSIEAGVKVDGNDVAAEGGKYIVNVSDNHNISISNHSGVNDIAVDGDEAAVVYNLQGVRVSGNASAGVYVKVVNGKASKVVVK